MMEKLWQVMGKLKEAPKEKRFNDTWTENTLILTDKPVSANYKFMIKTDKNDCRINGSKAGHGVV